MTLPDILSRVERELQVGLSHAVSLFQDRNQWKLDSPIEQAFAASLVMRGRLIGAPISGSRERAVAFHAQCYFIEPQVQIEQYRVDFLLGIGAYADDLSKCVVVECDGHDWHERTKEQAAADKARDRFLAMKVARVIRFTGSEIFKSPGDCSTEAMRVLNVVLEGQWP
jgi:very-short-patch-repair endonuclease